MIIFRYFLKEVYGTLLASTLILLLLLISNQFVHYLTQAASGIIPIRTVMQIMSIQVPLLLGILLPLGLYIGILMAYGRLYVDREMTVLSACGFSKAQLLGMTFSFSILVCALVAAIMFWVQPKVESYKRQILINAAAASPLEKIFQGQFNEVSNGLQFYVEKLSSDHQSLQNIFVAQQVPPKKKGDPDSWSITVAKEGRQKINPVTGDKFVVLQDGYRYMGLPGDADFQITQFKTYGVRIQPNAIPEETRVETYPTTQLWQQRSLNPGVQAELQWRLSLPLSVLILALLAPPLAKVDPRQGRYAQLLPAVLLYIVYINLLFMGKAWLKAGKISASLGLWWIHGIFLVIGLVLLGNFIGWRRIKSCLLPHRSPQPGALSRSLPPKGEKP